MIAHLGTNKAGDVDTHLDANVIKWLAIPVADRMDGTAYFTEINGCWWLWSTDNFRIHALRLGDAPMDHIRDKFGNELCLSITRLAWEMKFGKEASLFIEWPKDRNPDEHGAVPSRKIMGRDKEGHVTRNIDLWEAFPTELETEKFWRMPIEWHVDRAQFSSNRLSDALKGLDEQIVLGTPGDGTDAIVVAPMAKKQSELYWFVIVVATQPKLDGIDGGDE